MLKKEAHRRPRAHIESGRRERKCNIALKAVLESRTEAPSSKKVVDSLCRVECQPDSRDEHLGPQMGQADAEAASSHNHSLSH